MSVVCLGGLAENRFLLRGDREGLVEVGLDVGEVLVPDGDAD